MTYKRSSILLGAFLILSFLPLANAAPASWPEHERVLYGFCPGGGSCPDGANPQGPLIFGAAGHLYGTTYEGGVYNNNCNRGNGGGCGTVFELTSQRDGGWTEKVLHTFDYDGQDGTNPAAGLIFDAKGNLFGTTVGGGMGKCIINDVPVGCGIVFELSPLSDGEWAYTVLHNFSLEGGDGYYPWASLTLGRDGDLYGTTYNGGSNCIGYWGCGTVFKMYRRQGHWKEKVLYSFCNGNGTNCPDGAGPDASLIVDSAGNLYGTTFAGGNPNYGSYGTVFELHRSGRFKWTEEVLHSFNLNDGAYPTTSLVFDWEGNIYGTTSSFLVHPGAVFKLTRCSRGTWKETVLHVFGNGDDGAVAPSSLVFDATGNLYGVTGEGGNYGVGTIFRLTRRQRGRGWTEMVVYSFEDNKDSGDGPNAALVLDRAGNLYGTTGGGDGVSGTVFEFTW